MHHHCPCKGVQVKGAGVVSCVHLKVNLTFGGLEGAPGAAVQLHLCTACHLNHCINKNAQIVTSAAALHVRYICVTQHVLTCGRCVTTRT